MHNRPELKFIMKTILTPLLTLFFLFCCSLSFSQSDGCASFFTTVGPGDWDDPLIWDDFGIEDGGGCDGVPDGDDVVFIVHNVSLTKNEFFGTLGVVNSSTFGFVRLTIPSGDTLIGAVDAAIVCEGSGNFMFGQIFCSGYLEGSSMAINSSGSGGRATVQMSNGGHLSLTDDLTFSAATNANFSQFTATTTSGSQNRIDIAGNISGSGIYTGALVSGPHNSITNFNGSSGQIIPLGSGVTSVFGDVEINNSISVTTDTSFNSTNLMGYFTVNSGSVFNQGLIKHAFSDSVANHGTYNFNDSIDMEGGFTNTGTLTSSGGRINIAGDWTNTGTYTYFAGDTVTFDGAIQQNITGGSAFSVLELSNTAGAAPDIQFVSGAFVIDSIFDINDCVVDNRLGATITLSSTETRTAQMIDVGTGSSFAGNIELQRKLVTTTHGWRELGTGVDLGTIEDWRNDGVTMAGFPGSDFPYFSWNSVFFYLEPNANGTKNDGWQIPTSTGERIEPDKGFRLYTGNLDVNLTVTGEPRMGDQTIDVSNNCTTCTELTDYYEDGWNLVTNPYPCAVNWNTLLESELVNIDSIIHVYDATQAAYAWYVIGDSSPATALDSIIAHSQAFWVHATASSGEIKFKETHKVTAENNFVKSTGVMPKNRLNVRMTSAAHDYEDVAVLNISKGATSNFDRSKDFHKMFSPVIDEVPSIAFVSDDGVKLCYASIGEESSSISLKAFAGSLVLGTYTLNFENASNFSQSACVTLEDLVTGVTQDLKSNPSYTYVTLPGDDSLSRFLIHIEKQFDMSALDASCANYTDGSIEITHHAQTNYNVLWSDSDGNLLGSALSNSVNYVIENLSSDTYDVSISGACALPNELIEVGQPDEVVANFNLTSATVEVNEVVSLTNNSLNSANYLWQMGDGKEYQDFEPIHAYAAPGNYTIDLMSTSTNFGDCRDKKSQTIEVSLSTVDIEENVDGTLTAFEAKDVIVIRNTGRTFIKSIELYDIGGKLMQQVKVNSTNEVQLPCSTLAKGVYIINARTENGLESCKVTVN